MDFRENFYEALEALEERMAQQFEEYEEKADEASHDCSRAKCLRLLADNLEPVVQIIHDVRWKNPPRKLRSVKLATPSTQERIFHSLQNYLRHVDGTKPIPEIETRILKSLCEEYRADEILVHSPSPLRK